MNGSEWTELLSAALVGTERREIPDLLDRAAIEVVRQRAGRMALTGIVIGPAAAEEERPRVAGAAADRLSGLLADGRERLLAEWLTIAAERGLLAPPDRLPELLDLGARQRSLRRSIAVVAGRRGAYLAGLNPRWSWTAPEPADAWDIGTTAERRDRLARLRRDDPASAIGLLASTWSSEAARDRAAFVRMLGPDLSDADEPFLEAALDDRSEEVRSAAADQLARLPDSRFGRRMTERATGLLRIRDRTLELHPPSDCDEHMRRDGVRMRPPPEVGPRTWWLRQLLIRTPLRCWVGHLDATPEEILAMPAKGWTTSLRAFLSEAAVLQGDPVWASALLADPNPMRAGLLAVLPTDERTAHAARIVADSRLDGALVELLGELPGPWRGPLAEAVLAKLITGRSGGHRDSLAAYAAERLDPDHAGTWPLDHVDDPDFITVVRIRRDMSRELMP